MKAIFTVLVWALCCAFLVGEAEAKRKSEPEPPQVNQQAIQEGVMSFADSWLTLVSQGYLAFESAAQTPALRVQAKKMRFGAISSAVEIATIPGAGHLAEIDAPEATAERSAQFLGAA